MPGCADCSTTGRDEAGFDADVRETVYWLALLRYVRALTASPQTMRREDVDALRAAGATDGEILEANQVCAYFNYSNRLLNGLGVTIAGDVLGYSPPNTATLADWQHV